MPWISAWTWWYFFICTRCEQNKTDQQQTTNRQTNTDKTNNTDNTTNQSTTKATRPELTIWKRCCGGPARGCSGPKPTSKLGGQPSMLCDEWVTTIRLEHHYPETRHNATRQRQQRKNRTTRQTNRHSTCRPLSAANGRSPVCNGRRKCNAMD